MGLVGFLYTNKTPFHERKDYSFLEDPTLLISIIVFFDLICFVFLRRVMLLLLLEGDVKTQFGSSIISPLSILFTIAFFFLFHYWFFY